MLETAEPVFDRSLLYEEAELEWLPSRVLLLLLRVHDSSLLEEFIKFLLLVVSCSLRKLVVPSFCEQAECSPSNIRCSKAAEQDVVSMAQNKSEEFVVIFGSMFEELLERGSTVLEVEGGAEQLELGVAVY